MILYCYHCFPQEDVQSGSHDPGKESHDQGRVSHDPPHGRGSHDQYYSRRRSDELDWRRSARADEPPTKILTKPQADPRHVSFHQKSVQDDTSRPQKVPEEATRRQPQKRVMMRKMVEPPEQPPVEEVPEPPVVTERTKPAWGEPEKQPTNPLLVTLVNHTCMIDLWPL